MTPWFAELGFQVPEFYVSVSFPRTGDKSAAIGQCNYTSKDGRPHVLIHPYLDDPVQVLHVLLHELVHATLGIEAGHGKSFKQVAEALGLTGKMTATTASPELAATLAEMIRRGLGPYPHAALRHVGGRKKQPTRQLKVACPRSHGDKPYIVRMTRKWLDEMGPPFCPCGSAMEEAG